MEGGGGRASLVRQEGGRLEWRMECGETGREIGRGRGRETICARRKEFLMTGAQGVDEGGQGEAKGAVVKNSGRFELEPPLWRFPSKHAAQPIRLLRSRTLAGARAATRPTVPGKTPQRWVLLSAFAPSRLAIPPRWMDYEDNGIIFP